MSSQGKDADAPVKTMEDISREYNESGFVSYRGHKLTHRAGDNFFVWLPDGTKLEFRKLGQALRCVARAPLQ